MVFRVYHSPDGMGRWLGSRFWTILAEYNGMRPWQSFAWALVQSIMLRNNKRMWNSVTWTEKWIWGIPRCNGFGYWESMGGRTWNEYIGAMGFSLLYFKKLSMARHPWYERNPSTSELSVSSSIVGNILFLGGRVMFISVLLNLFRAYKLDYPHAFVEWTQHPRGLPMWVTERTKMTSGIFAASRSRVERRKLPPFPLRIWRVWQLHNLKLQPYLNPLYHSEVPLSIAQQSHRSIGNGFLLFSYKKLRQHGCDEYLQLKSPWRIGSKTARWERETIRILHSRLAWHYAFWFQVLPS